jgi:hypothetical protein
MLITLGALSVSPTPLPATGIDDWTWVPRQVLLRLGVCLLILGAVAHVSRRIAQLPHVVGAVAQESLAVYFIHLCVVYGSAWNAGLFRLYGEALSPAATLLAVVAVVLPMILLAWQWNALKHNRPTVARMISIAAGVGMVAFLL